MQFGKNKSEYIHRWYPFVEGYSKEFISKIVDEYKVLNKCQDIICLEPFAGSGTTPLELQDMGYLCYSFEVSPFMKIFYFRYFDNTIIIYIRERSYKFI